MNAQLTMYATLFPLFPPSHTPNQVISVYYVEVITRGKKGIAIIITRNETVYLKEREKAGGRMLRQTFAEFSRMNISIADNIYPGGEIGTI